jgi:hypothetical protein
VGSDRQASTEDLVFEIGSDAFGPRGSESGLPTRHPPASFASPGAAVAPCIASFPDEPK